MEEYKFEITKSASREKWRKKYQESLVSLNTKANNEGSA